MTTPNTKSYNDARWNAIKNTEIKDKKPDTAFYLDGSGFVTIGYGTLVTKNGATQSYANAVISNSSDPVLAQKLVDGFAGSKGSAAEVKASLEGKGFVFEGSKIVGFKDGVDASGKPIITDIKNVLSETGATKVTEGTIFPEKEGLVDRIESRFSTPFTEEQRAAVLSRVYNGVPEDDTIDAFAGKGTPEAALAFFASNRGGENGANPGHYARTIEEAREFLGDSVKAATVGNAKGFTYTDKDGSEVFIGSQDEKIGGKTKAEFVAYKVVTNDDQTQTQVPLGLSSLGKKGSMRFVDAAHLPLDPVVELNNATLGGDPTKILTALTLDPAIKTPQAALDALRQRNPEVGELQDVNLGTEAKPVWAKGYVLTDDDGKTTILAVGKDSKGKAALVGYEIDPVTETNPDPVPHAIPVSSPQSKIPALKVSDAGELGDPDVMLADASDDLPDIGTLPTFGPGVLVADASGGLPEGFGSSPAATNTFSNYLSGAGGSVYLGDQRARIIGVEIDLPAKPFVVVPRSGQYKWEATQWGASGELLGGVAHAGFHDVITASDGNNTVLGLGGNDALDGAAGSDWSNGLIEDDELLTLAQAGVQSLNVGYTNQGTNAAKDAQGNQHQQLGSFAKTDGSTQKMNDVWFSVDTSRMVDHNTVAVSADIAALLAISMEACRVKTLKIYCNTPR